MAKIYHDILIKDIAKSIFDREAFTYRHVRLSEKELDELARDFINVLDKRKLVAELEVIK